MQVPIVPTSPPKSALTCVLTHGHKKSVRTCRAHCVIGIAKHHQGNEQKKQIPHAVAYNREMCTAEAVHPLAYTQKTE